MIIFSQINRHSRHFHFAFQHFILCRVHYMTVWLLSRYIILPLEFRRSVCMSASLMNLCLFQNLITKILSTFWDIALPSRKEKDMKAVQSKNHVVSWLKNTCRMGAWTDLSTVLVYIDIDVSSEIYRLHFTVHTHRHQLSLNYVVFRRLVVVY